MSFQISPAFAQAELEYRQQRIKAGFPARTSGSTRRTRLSALLKGLSRRRPNTESLNSAPRQPLPSPHHLTSS